MTMRCDAADINIIFDVVRPLLCEELQAQGSCRSVLLWHSLPAHAHVHPEDIEALQVHS